MPYDALILSPLVGYAYHRIILDAAGHPVDYEFLEVNATFEKLTNADRTAQPSAGGGLSVSSLP